MTRRITWALIPVLLFVLLFVFFWRGLSLDPARLPSARLDQTLPAFQLPALGQTSAALSPELMHGEAVLLHVWASWCAVCAEEQVFLLKLAATGVPLYGLNYKDDSDDAAYWLQTWGNPYKMVGVDLDGRVGIDLGVYGTPETFLIDRQGIIRYRHVGALNSKVWDEVLRPQWERLT